MNLWCRLIWLLLTHRGRPALAVPFGVSRIFTRIWPLDLDLNGHLNNGRALTIMDLGRNDMMLRFGALPVMLRLGWVPILSAASVRFRRELTLFQKVAIQTRIVCWEGSNVVVEHGLYQINKGGTEKLACIALMRVGLYSRREKRFVLATEIMAALGFDAASPAPDADILAFLAADRAISTRA